MSARFVGHILEEVVGYIGAVAFRRSDRHSEVFLVNNLGEQLLFFLSGVAVLQEQFERGADYELVELLHVAVYGNENLAVLALDSRNFGIEKCGVFEVVVHSLPYRLRTAPPGPQFARGKELLNGERVEIF